MKPTLQLSLLCLGVLMTASGAVFADDSGAGQGPSSAPLSAIPLQVREAPGGLTVLSSTPTDAFAALAYSGGRVQRAHPPLFTNAVLAVDPHNPGARGGRLLAYLRGKSKK